MHENYIFKLRKASGSFIGDPEVSFQQVLSDVREGNSKTRVFEMEVGRWIRVAEQPMKGGGWVSTLEDITQWRELQEQIAYKADHDALTGLPNRALFREPLPVNSPAHPVTKKLPSSASVSTISKISTTPWVPLPVMNF
jgi:hypothetical protein